MPRKRTPTHGCIANRMAAEPRLAYLGHLLIENRHGLIADAMATLADGFAEACQQRSLLRPETQRSHQRQSALVDHSGRSPSMHGAECALAHWTKEPVS